MTLAKKIKPFHYHIPNMLSLVRIVLTPIIMFCMAAQSLSVLLTGLFLFIIAVMTDFYDGYFARRLCATSRTGIFLDPVADKVLVIGLFGMFFYQGMLSNELFGLVVVRELLITVMRGICWYNGFLLPAHASGKLKTSVQCASLLLFFIARLFAFAYLDQQMSYYVLWGATCCLYFAVFLGWYSAFWYCRRVRYRQ